MSSASAVVASRRLPRYADERGAIATDRSDAQILCQLGGRAAAVGRLGCGGCPTRRRSFNIAHSAGHLRQERL